MAVPSMVQYTTCKHAIIGITKTAGEYIPSPLRQPVLMYYLQLWTTHLLESG